MTSLERELLQALETLLAFEPGGSPPLTMPRGLAVDRAKAVTAKARAALKEHPTPRAGGGDE